MIKKLSFAIENAEMIQENTNSNFALLALDFFASGDNLHDMYVSEETLMRTADTIKNCPLVWKYDEVLDDVYTHDPEEVPCGFVPESSEIKTKKLEDGRTMLSAIAYVWKRYTGPLLSFFKRDGGKKPVSVEMSVYKTQTKENGKTELLDFRYEGITVLGSYVTPAIPLANASVLSFEYEEDLEKEFSFSEIIIPNKVRYNAEKGLEIRKEQGGGTSTGIAFARYLTKNKIIIPEKIKEIDNYFTTHKNSKETVDWLLFGGEYGREWVRKIVEKMDNKEIVTFPYKSKSDVNPALKGITPPISLAQANAIAAQADKIGVSKEKNGWAIAISSFRKTHHVEEGKWVKNAGNTAKAAADSQDDVDMDWQYWEEIVEEDFAAEDMGKGEAIQVNKSKDAMSDTAWGSVDKTSLMHKVLNASNYKALVHDVYLVVDSGWEEHPSSSLHYPIMSISDGKAVYNKGGLASALGRAKGQDESGVVSKINGLYEKLGLNSDKKEMAMTEEELAKMAAEEEAKKKAAEEEAKKFAAEEEAKKVAAEEQAKKFAAEEEAKRIAAEEQAKKFAAEEEAKKVAAEEEAKKVAEEKKFQLETMSKFFSDDEDEDDVKMAKTEIAKGFEAADFGLIMNAIYSKFCKMQETMSKFAEEKKAYMAENEELKKFKAELEGQQKEFAINETLKELSASVYLPDDVKAEMKADAVNYTLENIEAWKNACKAKSFDFAMRVPQNKGVIEVGLPFGGVTKPKDNLWG